MATVYLNGEFIPAERAMVSVDDRGFIFGDGIYEGVRAIRGKLFAWPAHAARMTNGLAGLRIELPADRVAALGGVAEQLVRDNGLAGGEAFIYMQVTRGAARRTHHFPPPGTVPTVYVSATGFAPDHELRQRGCSTILSEDLRWARCDLKTINLIPTVLARQAAAEVGAYEAILVKDGIITEGAASSVFAVIEGIVRTHPLDQRILPSVTREVVLACARELQIATREAAITVNELMSAEEVFLCGTRTDVVSVVEFNGLPVGSGAPGPVAARLRQALDNRLQAAG